MGKLKINPNLKPRTEIVRAMTGFMPRFGNQQDIDIVKTHEEIIHLRTLAEGEDKRREEVRGMIKTSKARANEIISKEKRLIYQLKSRKLSTD